MERRRMMQRQWKRRKVAELRLDCSDTDPKILGEYQERFVYEAYGVGSLGLLVFCLQGRGLLLMLEANVSVEDRRQFPLYGESEGCW